jgi:hypothetical protein
LGQLIQNWNQIASQLADSPRNRPIQEQKFKSRCTQNKLTLMGLEPWAVIYSRFAAKVRHVPKGRRKGSLPDEALWFYHYTRRRVGLASEARSKDRRAKSGERCAARLVGRGRDDLNRSRAAVW